MQIFNNNMLRHRVHSVMEIILIHIERVAIKQSGVVESENFILLVEYE